MIKFFSGKYELKIKPQVLQSTTKKCYSLGSWHTINVIVRESASHIIHINGMLLRLLVYLIRTNQNQFKSNVR